MGHKIYEKQCSDKGDLNLHNFSSYEALKDYLNSSNNCGKLSQKHLEALTLYLWDIKRHKHELEKKSKLSVTKDEKCPVCGMFLYKYPEWICRIYYKDQSFAFDGIKDMFKYYFEHQANIVTILVQDYYSREPIDAKRAFFVIGSDVYGPMGHELIAFEKKEDAKTFLFDHKGKEIVEFNDITVDRVYRLDE